MKSKNLFLIFICTLLLTSCGQNNEEKKINEKNNKYKENISLDYYGVNNKTFNYKIRNDKLGACKVKEDKKYKNGDKLSIACKNDKEQINFTKEFTINNLLKDDINEKSIRDKVALMSKNSEHTLIKQDEYGFSLILFIKTSPNTYNTDIYQYISLKKMVS